MLVVCFYKNYIDLLAKYMHLYNKEKDRENVNRLLQYADCSVYCFVRFSSPVFPDT